MSTLTDAQTRLAAAESAYDKALTGQTVVYGDKRVTRHDIKMLRDEIAYWNSKVINLTARAAGVSNPGVMLPKWT